jgi:hypothetical protein
MINNHYKNTHDVLTELLESLQSRSDLIDAYFDHIKEGEVLNPLLAGAELKSAGNDEALPPEFFKGFGIRRLILDSPHGRLSLSEKNFTDIIGRNAATFNWRDLKGDYMEDLKMLFANCQMVEFESWSDIVNASEIWDNLRRDVILPLNKNDFDFVFYLGDTSKKFAFEVDEMLDIISGYALHGRVTLILDGKNAASLWERAHGGDSHAEISTSPGLNEKCRSLFDTMDISHLILLDSFSLAISFSKQNQFEITDCKSFGTAKTERKYFDIGYILGLILKFDLLHSIIVGLAVSGVYEENGAKPDSKRLIHFIETYLEEIESFRPEENHLSFV